MEASKQQRRPAVGSLANALADAQLDFDAIDLVDMLWLAQFTESAPVAQQEAESDPTPTKLPTVDIDDAPIEDQGLNLYSDSDAPPQSQPDTQTAGTEAAPPQGTPFSVPAAPALRTRMDLARALRPLMRKVPSRTRFELDEAATVTQIAQTEVWMPVVRPRPERWLELDLVVESSKTTVIWERAIAELNHLAEYQGAFRAIRTWRLNAPTGKVQLFPRWRDYASERAGTQVLVGNQRPHTPRELIDPTGRRLIWLVSDCTSNLWRQGLIHPTLMDWSRGQVVAIVQMFPASLWTRTALRDGHQVKLSALAPGLPNAQLEIEGLPTRLEQRAGVDLATLPIVTLDAGVLGGWARVVAGQGDTRTPGRTFDLAFIRRQAQKLRADQSRQATTQRTAQERVALFRSTASKTARRLANLMAATPVSLPVIDLLRDAFRADFGEEEIRQSHVAEVLLSGLLRRCDTEADALCRYEFFGDGTAPSEERVRDILLGDASVSKTVAVLNVLSASICQKLGRSQTSFQALLGDLQNAEQRELREAALPFAKVGLDVLRRLGGEYAALALRYAPGIDGDDGVVESVDSTFTLEEEEYEVVELIDFPPLTDFDFIDAQFDDTPSFPPPLQTVSFTVITFEAAADSLEQFDFTVATLQRQATQTQGQQQSSGWLIQRQTQSASRLVESLPSDIDLEMVVIPGGSFTMGSPDDEPGRYDKESPQHAVTVAPFCMGRYPITQAQWRVVAALPQIERELTPDPARFKRDNRPVENVSWHDAVEFCARLSAHTGRTYRLPSEAEWEYACRAGATTPFHFGDMISTDYVNYNGHNGGAAYVTVPKGKFRGETTRVDYFGIANAFGLSDMHGNVFEWCQDSWHSNYEGAPIDGSVWPGDSPSRVRRGGSWNHFPGYCRSASRLNGNADYRLDIIGFRVCCSAPRAL